MGKAGRRKFLKKERAKVKLKGTKKPLPKGQNLTDTNFKIKKIVIKDQIKEHLTDEVLSRKKLNQKELLSRLQHHNSSVKQDALDGLRDLISQYPKETLGVDTAKIIDSVSKSILDTVPEVRREANKLLTLILSQVPLIQLSPLFSALCSYLTCGLTHIDQAVRADSLKLFDTLLLYCPSLCAKHCSRLLPISLDLVSETTTGSRALSLHLESTMTAGKWRVKVLERLRSLLLAIATSSEEDVDEQEEDDVIVQRVIKWDENSPVDVPLLPINCNILKPAMHPNLNTISNFGDTPEFDYKEFGKSLVPLLLDAFVELVPNNETKDPDERDSCINPLAAEFLNCTADIIQNLWDILQKENEAENRCWLRSNFGEIILNRLVTGKFPYSTRHQHSNKKKKKDSVKLLKMEEIEPACYSINLKLCRIVILTTKPTKWKPMISYVKNCLRLSNKLGTSACKALKSCFFEICVNNPGHEAADIVSSVAKLCVNTENELSNHLFDLLVHIALEPELFSKHRGPDFDTWLGSLPKLLLNDVIPPEKFKAVCQIARCDYSAFSQAFDGYIEAILDNVPHCQVPGWEIEEVHLRMAELVFWVKDWDGDLVDGVVRGIKDEYWGKTVTKHVKSVINFLSDQNSIPNLKNLLMANEWWCNNT